MLRSLVQGLLVWAAAMAVVGMVEGVVAEATVAEATVGGVMAAAMVVAAMVVG